MAERTYRNVDIDLDDLADALVLWFERDGFEVQDFQEGPAILIQAKKQNLVTKLSFTSQALNVRFVPLARGLKVDITVGEWLDKGVGAVAAVALRVINPLVAVGAAAATGYGVYQQLRLPELTFEFLERYLDEHGVYLGERESEARRRRSQRRDVGDLENELEELRREPEMPHAGVAREQAAPGKFCPSCGTEVTRGSRFCHACGQALSAAPPPAEPPAADA